MLLGKSQIKYKKKKKNHQKKSSTSFTTEFPKRTCQVAAARPENQKRIKKPTKY